jgi:hypothetical protein
MTYLCESFISSFRLSVFLDELYHAIFGIIEGSLRIGQRGLMLIRTLFPFVSPRLLLLVAPL